MGIPLVMWAVLSSCSTAGVQRAYMSVDPEGRRQRDVFFTDSEAIYCVAEVTSGRDDFTVRMAVHANAIFDPAQRKYRDGPVFVVGNDSPIGKTPTARAVLEFRADVQGASAGKVTPYLPGQYTCQIFADGELEEELPFEIRFPGCPSSHAQNGTVCEGFYEDGISCPGDRGTCRCTAGVWACSP